MDSNSDLPSVFPKRGSHARSAVGMATMPFDVAIEVEAVFFVK